MDPKLQVKLIDLCMRGFNHLPHRKIQPAPLKIALLEAVLLVSEKLGCLATLNYTTYIISNHQTNEVVDQAICHYRNG